MDFKLDKIQTNMLIYNISGIYYWVRHQTLKKTTQDVPRKIL